MSVFILTETHPDEYFDICEEYDNFEDAKAQLLSYYKDGDVYEDNNMYIAECIKTKARDMISYDGDDIIETMEERLYDEVSKEFEFFDEESRKKAISILDAALEEIKKFESLQGYYYQILVNKEETRIWFIDFETGEVVQEAK